MNKCEKALESDATKEENTLDEIEQQLNSVSLSKQKIKQSKRYTTLNWTTCYDDLCWTHLEEKKGANWFSRKLKLAI